MSVRPTATYGPVAQLGARLNGIQEVTGSIPVRSTNLSNKRDRLCYRIFLHSPWQNAVSFKGRARELNAQRLILRGNVATGSIRV
jgi:hypothetical protein